MAFQTGYNSQEAQLTMSLSELCYVAETPLTGESIQEQEQRISAGITAGLGNAGYSAWTVAWGPALSDDRGNMMYAVQNTSSNQYAVAVRGTDWSFILDWIEDFAALLSQVPYVGTPSKPNIKIAAGTALGLTVLQNLTDNSTGATVLEFLQSTASSSGIFVTGHSLGGCLASALAPIIANALGGSTRLKVYTFAAPSPGNDAFATYYNKLFRNSANSKQSTAFRVFDTLDAVPNAWASLPVINTYYQGFILAPQEIQDVINFAQSVVGNGYVQLGVPGDDSAHPLQGHIIWPSATSHAAFDPIADALFLWQVAQQHSGLNYLSLLGVTQPTSSDVARVQSALATISAVRRATTA